VTHFHEPLPHPAVSLAQPPFRDPREAKESELRLELELEKLLTAAPETEDEAQEPA
jgi:hypothetical protein